MRTFNILTTAALLAISGAASALDVSANIELDNTHLDQGRGLNQTGRVEVNVSGKAGSNMFVAGKAALIAGKAGGVATDDMWIQLGSKDADVKLGRFEGADLFPLPGDTLVDHAGTVHTANSNLRGRKGNDEFHMALTGNFGAVSAELGVVETKTGATKGLRPVFTYAGGPLTAKLGFESGKFNASGRKVNDLGLSVAYDFSGFKLTGNLSSGKQDVAGSKNKFTTLGLIGTFGPANLGFINGKADGMSKVSTVYASYSMPLFDIKGASVTPAFSTSKAGSAKSNGLRVRLNYTF